MDIRTNPYIAREGWRVLSIAVGVALLVHATVGMPAAIPVWMLVGVMFVLFRNPRRAPPSLPLALVSAVHGTVARAGSAYDPWLGRNASIVVTRMGLFDVHSVYSPTEGKLVEQWSRPAHARGGHDPTRKTVAFLIRTDEGDDIVVALSCGRFGGPVSFQYHPGERVGHGRRIGLAVRACTVSIFAPENTIVQVTPEDYLLAGNTVIASLVHQRAVTAIPERLAETLH